MINLTDEARHYIVLVPEWYFGGRTYYKGQTIEDRNTMEVLTHVALGNLALATDVVPPPQRPPAVPVHLPAAPAPELVEEQPQPQRRRYVRRDMAAD